MVKNNQLLAYKALRIGMKASAPFSETRNEMLQDPKFAGMYLKQYLNEDPEFFNVALKYVADAYPGGISALSRSTYLNRESLYRALKRWQSKSEKSHQSS